MTLTFLICLGQKTVCHRVQSYHEDPKVSEVITQTEGGVAAGLRDPATVSIPASGSIWWHNRRLQQIVTRLKRKHKTGSTKEEGQSRKHKTGSTREEGQNRTERKGRIEQEAQSRRVKTHEDVDAARVRLTVHAEVPEHADGMENQLLDTKHFA